MCGRSYCGGARNTGRLGRYRNLLHVSKMSGLSGVSSLGFGRKGVRRTGSGIPTNSEMSSHVDVSLCLHIILERPDRLAVRYQRRDLRGRGITRYEVAANVALDAARVVAITIGAWVSRRVGVGHGGHGTIGVSRLLEKEEEGRTNPRLTFMSLKGPLAIHPPPLPTGLIPLLLCVTFSPCPPILVSLPSKSGLVSGVVQRPQSQYGWVPLYPHSTLRACSYA